MKDTLTTQQRRRLFFIFGELKFDADDRHNFISQWTKGRTASLKDLGFIEARDMIRQLEESMRTPQSRRVNEAKDTKRKGVIRAIYAYLENQGVQPTMDYVKAIAVRASGIAPTGDTNADFNRIGFATLSRIYNEFCLKQKVQAVKSDITFKFSMN